MKTYVLKRLLLMIPTLFGVSVVVFAVVTATPAPPIAAQVPSGIESAAETGSGSGSLSQSVKVFRAQYGLDKPRVLNTYYALETSEVRETLARSLQKELDPGEQREAQESLIEWGWYAVPHYVKMLDDGPGPVRDAATSWLVKSAERVATGEEGGRVSDRQAQLNAEINTEVKILRLYGEAKSRESLKAWYRGAKAQYPSDLDAAAVRAAVVRDEDAKFAEWGPRAVPALVSLVLEEEELRDRAIKWLVRAGQRPAEGDDAAGIAAQNEALSLLEWDRSAREPRRRAGVTLVRDWWNGVEDRWDYSGLGWARVLFLETQFALYWGNLIRFDLGNSTVHKIPVSQLIAERFKYSLTLAVTSLILAYLISVPIGVASAKWHNRPGERATSLLLFALYSLPSFYVATLVVKHLALGQPGSLELIPDGRFEDIDAWSLPSGAWVRNILWHIVAPIACMTYGSFAALSRYAKSGVLNVIRSDYVRTARAKGVKESTVIIKHAARNGLIPIVTLLGTTLPAIVGGSFIIEMIFSIPGFGQLTVQSIFNRDYNVVVGISLVVAVLTMIGLLLADLLYAVVDPRISLS